MAVWSFILIVHVSPRVQPNYICFTSVTSMLCSSLAFRVEEYAICTSPSSQVSSSLLPEGSLLRPSMADNYADMTTAGEKIGFGQKKSSNLQFLWFYFSSTFMGGTWGVWWVRHGWKMFLKVFYLYSWWTLMLSRGGINMLIWKLIKNKVDRSNKWNLHNLGGPGSKTRSTKPRHDLLGLLPSFEFNSTTSQWNLNLQVTIVLGWCIPKTLTTSRSG